MAEVSSYCSRHSGGEGILHGGDIWFLSVRYFCYICFVLMLIDADNWGR